MRGAQEKFQKINCCYNNARTIAEGSRSSGEQPLLGAMVEALACDHVGEASNFGQPHHGKMLKGDCNFSNGACAHSGLRILQLKDPIYMQKLKQQAAYRVHISFFTDGWQSFPNARNVWTKNPLWVTIAISFSFLVHNLPSEWLRPKVQHVRKIYSKFKTLRHMSFLIKYFCRDYTARPKVQYLNLGAQNHMTAQIEQKVITNTIKEQTGNV